MCVHTRVFVCVCAHAHADRTLVRLLRVSVLTTQVDGTMSPRALKAEYKSGCHLRHSGISLDQRWREKVAPSKLSTPICHFSSQVESWHACLAQQARSATLRIQIITILLLNSVANLVFKWLFFSKELQPYKWFVCNDGKIINCQHHGI